MSCHPEYQRNQSIIDRRLTRKRICTHRVPTEEAHRAPLTNHPLADLFPLIGGAASEELTADIRQHGVREPVVLYEGKILDGRNRWRAARKARVPCPTRVCDHAVIELVAAC